MAMGLKSLAKLVLPIAKTLGTALAGPAGPVVNVALGLLGNALGVEPKAAAIEQALTADPEALAKVRVAEIDADKRYAELEVDVFKIAAEDKQSARNFAKSTSMVPQIILSVVFILGYFIALQFILTEMVSVDESVKVLIASLLGLFTREIPTIMQFWFGSSAGSKAKVSAP